jgi:hypothetical protein
MNSLWGVCVCPAACLVSNSPLYIFIKFGIDLHCKRSLWNLILARILVLSDSARSYTLIHETIPGQSAIDMAAILSLSQCEPTFSTADSLQ